MKNIWPRLFAFLFLIPLALMLPLGCENIGLGPNGEIPSQYAEEAKKLMGLYQGEMYSKTHSSEVRADFLGSNSFDISLQNNLIKLKWKRDPLGIDCSTKTGKLKKITQIEKQDNRVQLEFLITSEKCKEQIFEPILKIILNPENKTLYFTILTSKKPLNGGKRQKYTETYLTGELRKSQ